MAWKMKRLRQINLKVKLNNWFRRMETWAKTKQWHKPISIEAKIWRHTRLRCSPSMLNICQSRISTPLFNSNTKESTQLIRNWRESSRRLQHTKNNNRNWVWDHNSWPAIKIHWTSRTNTHNFTKGIWSRPNPFQRNRLTILANHNINMAHNFQYLHIRNKAAVRRNSKIVGWKVRFNLDKIKARRFQI